MDSAGTAKQVVTYDYALRIANGRAAAQAGITAAFQVDDMLPDRLYKCHARVETQALTGDTAAPFTGCDLTNATICPALEAGTAQVPAGWAINKYLCAYAPSCLPCIL